MRKLILAAASAGALVLLPACAEDTAAPDASIEEQRAYIDAIVPHHEVAGIRADEAIAKANRQWLRDKAAMMKEDQGREIAAFRSHRMAILGSDTTPPPMMPEPIPAGSDFDRMWVMDMIAHHQGAIDQSTLALGSGMPTPLDTLARHTIDEQRREQAEFMDSLAAWSPASAALLRARGLPR